MFYVSSLLLSSLCLIGIYLFFIGYPDLLVKSGKGLNAILLNNLIPPEDRLKILQITKDVIYDNMLNK